MPESSGPSGRSLFSGFSRELSLQPAWCVPLNNLPTGNGPKGREKKPRDEAGSRFPGVTAPKKCALIRDTRASTCHSPRQRIPIPRVSKFPALKERPVYRKSKQKKNPSSVRATQALPRSAINFTTMADTVDAHNVNCVGNLVNDPIVAHADAPVVLTSSSKLAGSRAVVGPSPVLEWPQ